MHVLDVWHYYHGANAALVAGDLAAAEHYADQMQAALTPGQLMNKVNYQYLRAAILLHRGETQSCALDLAEEYLTLADALGSGMGSTIFRLQLALTLIAAVTTPARASPRACAQARRGHRQRTAALHRPVRARPLAARHRRTRSGTERRCAAPSRSVLNRTSWRSTRSRRRA